MPARFKGRCVVQKSRRKKSASQFHPSDCREVSEAATVVQPSAVQLEQIRKLAREALRAIVYYHTCIDGGIRHVELGILAGIAADAIALLRTEAKKSGLLGLLEKPRLCTVTIDSEWGTPIFSLLAILPTLSEETVPSVTEPQELDDTWYQYDRKYKSVDALRLAVEALEKLPTLVDDDEVSSNAVRFGTFHFSKAECEDPTAFAKKVADLIFGRSRSTRVATYSGNRRLQFADGIIERLEEREAFATEVLLDLGGSANLSELREHSMGFADINQVITALERKFGREYYATPGGKGKGGYKTSVVDGRRTPEAIPHQS